MQRWNVKDLERFSRSVFVGVGTEPDIATVVAGHPITEGVADFTTADEQHTPIIYDGSQVHRVLNSRMDNGTVVPAGWVREVGRGRVCHLVGGHPLEPLLHPMYQRLMRNAVEWCLWKR